MAIPNKEARHTYDQGITSITSILSFTHQTNVTVELRYSMLCIEKKRWAGSNVCNTLLLATPFQSSIIDRMGISTHCQVHVSSHIIFLHRLQVRLAYSAYAYSVYRSRDVQYVQGQ